MTDAARDVEDQMLQVCVQVALGKKSTLESGDQANAVGLLALLLNDNDALKNASQKYFSLHPEQKKEMNDLLGEPWMLGFSRFKNMFNQYLIFSQM